MSVVNFSNAHFVLCCLGHVNHVLVVFIYIVFKLFHFLFHMLSFWKAVNPLINSVFYLNDLRHDYFSDENRMNSVVVLASWEFRTVMFPFSTWKTTLTFGWKLSEWVIRFLITYCVAFFIVFINLIAEIWLHATTSLKK